MLKGGYTFEKYSVALPIRKVMPHGVAANEARALRARSPMALVSQNALNMFNHTAHAAHI